MRLTTVIGAANNNPNYYLFIPKQIHFWKRFNIKFIAVFVGQCIPDELKDYTSNIMLWSKNVDIHNAFIAQNIRIYYPALLNLPDDEMVMITDMDMLPMNNKYYTEGLENYTTDDFIYYRHIDGNQIYMCYNAAHPKTWGKVFGISTEDDIEKAIRSNYRNNYNGIPGSTGWFTDQLIMYDKLIHYPNLKVLNRPSKRLETWTYDEHMIRGEKAFIHQYDDAHFHRSYSSNIRRILDAERQL